jgi:hypothetical protein
MPPDRGAQELLLQPTRLRAAIRMLIAAKTYIATTAINIIKTHFIEDILIRKEIIVDSDYTIF